MRQDFTIAGPFGKLSGVINLCEEELGRRHVLVMATGSGVPWKAPDGLPRWQMNSGKVFAAWSVSISAGAPC